MVHEYLNRETEKKVASWKKYTEGEWGSIFANYLSWMVELHQELILPGIDGHSNLPSSIDLESVYLSLKVDRAGSYERLQAFQVTFLSFFSPLYPFSLYTFPSLHLLYTPLSHTHIPSFLTSPLYPPFPYTYSILPHISFILPFPIHIPSFLTSPLYSLSHFLPL